MSETIVGIDLGTTNSEIAVYRDGRPDVQADGSGRLILPSVVGLDQDHLVAVVLAQRVDEPVVKPTDLEHGDERFALGQPLAGELLKEGVDLLRLRRDLPGLQDVAAFVAE